MKTYIRETKNLGKGVRRTTTYTPGEWAAHGIIGGLIRLCVMPFVWIFKLMYWMTFGWIVAIIKAIARKRK